MSNEASLDATALAAEMQSIAQTVILEWFADMLRVRLATQSPSQRALTIAFLQDGLDQAMARHDTQTRPAPLSAADAQRAELFKYAFTQLAGKLMTTMGRGLTDEEKAALA